jgi:hypothetical protein
MFVQLLILDKLEKICRGAEQIRRKKGVGQERVRA